MLPALDKHFSSYVNCVDCEDVYATSIQELVILARVLGFEWSLCGACESTLVKVGAFGVALDLFNLPVLEVVHGNVLIEGSILWLLERRVVSRRVKS